MNEFQAALGLLQLKYIDNAIEKRKAIARIYKSELAGIKGIRTLHDIKDITHNYSYFPIFVNKELFGNDRDYIYNKLKEVNIYSRKYFYPLISQFPTYKGLESAQAGKMPIAEKVAEEVICLPIYSELDFSAVKDICEIIRG